MIQLLKLSRWQQQSIKSSTGAFWRWGSMWLHQSHAWEAGPGCCISPGLRLGMPWTWCGTQACPPSKALLQSLVFCVWRASEVCTQPVLSLWSCSSGGLCSEILRVMVTPWETTALCSPCSRRAPLCFVWAGSSAYCSLLSSCWWGQVLQGGPRWLLDVVRGPQGPSRQRPPWKGSVGTAFPSGQDSGRRWPSRAWPFLGSGSRAVLARPHHLQHQGPQHCCDFCARRKVGKKCPWVKSWFRQPENVVQGAECRCGMKWGWGVQGGRQWGRRLQGKCSKHLPWLVVFLNQVVCGGSGAGVSKGPRQPRINPPPLFWWLSHF